MNKLNDNPNALEHDTLLSSMNPNVFSAIARHPQFKRILAMAIGETICVPADIVYKNINIKNAGSTADVCKMNNVPRSLAEGETSITIEVNDELKKYNSFEKILGTELPGNLNLLHIDIKRALNLYHTEGTLEFTKTEKVFLMFQLTSRKEIWKIAEGDEDLEALAKIIFEVNENEDVINLCKAQAQHIKLCLFG